jgi:hypothetical protein
MKFIIGMVPKPKPGSTKTVAGYHQQEGLVINKHEEKKNMVMARMGNGEGYKGGKGDSRGEREKDEAIMEIKEQSSFMST